MNRRRKLNHGQTLNHGLTVTSRFWIAGIAGATLVAAAGLTRANASDVLASQDVSPSGPATAFTLTEMQNAAVMSYSAPRELRICNGTALATSSRNTASAQSTPAAPAASGTAANPLVNQPVPLGRPTVPMPLEISYSGTTNALAPEECLRLRARRVRIASSALPLMPGYALYGTVQWINADAANAPLPGSVVDETSHQMVADMVHQLKRDDRTILAATDELNLAREELLAATQELQPAPQELHPIHVASADFGAGIVR